MPSRHKNTCLTIHQNSNAKICSKSLNHLFVCRSVTILKFYGLMSPVQYLSAGYTTTRAAAAATHKHLKYQEGTDTNTSENTF